jgi:branched-chain amino acid transport system substrate-binding protein
MLTAGKDIDFDGASGPIEFNAAGDPAEATIGVYQYGPDNTNKNISYNTGKIDG